MEKVNLEEFKLTSGNHKSIDGGACIMEMVSYLANEPWSDHPGCACPILTEYAIRLNDRFTDKDRQKLKPLIPKLINTRSTDETQIKRKQFLMFRSVTAVYPALLDLVKYPSLPEKLRSFGNNSGDMNKAAGLLLEHGEAVRKHADADAYADADDYADANANAYANAYDYADANANAYANAYANANAYADADDYAYAYANAYANAYAYANTSADAYAIRDKISDLSVETLSLACEIT